MPIELNCLDKNHKNEVWKLDLDQGKAVITDSSGNVLANLEPEQAMSLFRMPSFSENVKYFGLRTPDGILQFKVGKSELKQIKYFLDSATVSAGPEAVAGVKRKAIRDLVIGVLCVLGGIIVTALGYLAAATNSSRGSHTIFYGLVLFGLIMLGKGIVGFRQYTRLSSMNQAKESEN